MQSYLFAGFPTALISLKVFKEIFPSLRNTYKVDSTSELLKRGEVTCKKIYGIKYRKLIKNVNEFSPELSKWLVIEGYGKVLSRNQLKLKEREMAIIAMLAVLKFEDQLYSHINGAVRIGIEISEISDLIDSLEILGNKSFSKFGRSIFEIFIEKKDSI